MAPAQGGTDKSAKEVFDEIGKTIQEQAKREAEGYSNVLKGNLSNVRFTNGEKTGVRNPCDLLHNYETNVNTGKSDPCLSRLEDRFSDTEGAKCYSYGIKGNDSTIGVCAPYRRLHLCVQNLEQINPEQITSIHNLLADVLLAAKHEGAAISRNHDKYKLTNSSSQICTMLARSFADLGDIIRGKDLYLGHKLGNNRLEARLKMIFQNIYDKNPNLNVLSIEQVKEYWWALNRDQVWKAITCGATMNDIFSKNIRNSRTTLFDYKCGHGYKNIPTNLDYVPQYLRWFDEWSEEFCRKRNNKLKLAMKECRGEHKEKYCSLNGYDCTKPIEKGDSCSRTDKCTACSNICNPYQLWLEKQQNEFKIQKDKYENEIKTKPSNTVISNSNINNKYNEEFYKELKRDFESVDTFLHLLNNGSYCKEGVKVESPIDFNETGNKHAFYRSDYCQRCPDCLVVCDNLGCKENKKHDNCRSKIIEEILKDEKPTPIKVVFSGDGKGVITEKLDDFCSNPTKGDGQNYKKWKCYNKNSDYDKCEMISWLYEDPNESNLMLSIKCFVNFRFFNTRIL